MGGLFQELSRRKVFRVAGIYVVAAWVILQVADTVSPLMNLSDSVPRLVLFMMLLLFPVVLILAWVFQFTSDGIKVQTGKQAVLDTTLSTNQTVSYAAIGLLGLAMLTLAVSQFVLPEESGSIVLSDANEPELSGADLVESMRSIAVLPFENFSTDEETGFFAQGLSEEILDQLVANDNFRVASRTASFQAAEQGEELDVVAEKLQVAYVLEGSVRRLGGDDLRITAQLIRASDGFHLWSKTYQESFSGGFEMQSAVAANIAFVGAEELKFDVLRNYEPLVNDDYAGIDPAAVRYYFDALYEYVQLRLGEGGDLNLVERYQKLAVEIDPNFYLAHIDLAWLYGQRLDGSMPRAEASLKAHAAIDKVLELDPTNLEILFHLGQISLIMDWNLDLAEASLEQFLSRNPDCPYCYVFLAAAASVEGRISESQTLLTTGRDSVAGLEKVIMSLPFIFGMLFEGEIEQALEIISDGLILISDGVDRVNFLQHQAMANIQLGNIEEAKVLIDEAWDVDSTSHGEYFIVLYAKTGQEAKARAILSDQKRELSDYGLLALAYLALGEVDNTLKFIELGIEERSSFLAVGLQRGTYWNEIRDDPRFDELLALMESKIIHTERYWQDHDRPIL